MKTEDSNPCNSFCFLLFVFSLYLYYIRENPERKFCRIKKQKAFASCLKLRCFFWNFSLFLLKMIFSFSFWRNLFEFFSIFCAHFSKGLHIVFFNNMLNVLLQTSIKILHPHISRDGYFLQGYSHQSLFRIQSSIRQN